MDNGEVIPGLNEGWTLWGAKLSEWLVGVMTAMLVAAALQMNFTRSMPILIFVALGSVYGMASLRKQFPDEERGVANLCMSSLNFAPPGIPKPARVQPFWSGAPMKSLPEKREFSQLGLAEMLAEAKNQREAIGTGRF